MFLLSYDVFKWILIVASLQLGYSVVCDRCVMTVTVKSSDHLVMPQD